MRNSTSQANALFAGTRFPSQHAGFNARPLQNGAYEVSIGRTGQLMGVCATYKHAQAYILSLSAK